MHNIDQLVQQLKQDGHVKFQLLSPEEAAHLNGLVHGISSAPVQHLMLVLPFSYRATHRS